MGLSQEINKRKHTHCLNLHDEVNSGKSFWTGFRGAGFVTGKDDIWMPKDLREAAGWKTTVNSGSWVMADGHPTTTVLTSAATEDSVVWGVLTKDGGTTAHIPFNILATGETLAARIKLKVDSILLSQVIFGFLDNTVPFASGAANSVNGCYLHSAVGGQLSGVLAKASTRTSQTLTGYSLVADTYKVLGVKVYSQTGAVEFYVNDSLVYSQTTLTNLPLAATNLSLMLALNPESAVARVLTYKEAFAYQEAA